MYGNHGYLKIILAAVLWGTSGLFARWSGLSAVDLAFYKTLFACLALLVMLPREELMIKKKFKSYIVIFLAGILYALNAFLFLSSIYMTTLSNSLFAYYTKPVIVAFLSPVFFKEKPEFTSIAAIVISLLGLFLILTPSVLELAYTDLVGIFLSLMAAVSASIVVILIKLIQIPSPVVVYYKMVVASLVLAPLTDFNIGIMNKGIIIAIIMGICHTLIPYVLYYSGMQAVKASHGITLTYFDPVVASFAGVIIFSEPFSALTLFGGVLILASGTLILNH